MSKATLKKALTRLDRDALQELMLELYTARREAREYLDFWADPDIDREAGLASERLRKLFFQSSGKPRSKVPASAVSDVLKNFRTLCPDPERVAVLMLESGEVLLEWLRARDGRGMSAARTRLDNTVRSTRAYIDSNDQGTTLDERLRRLEENVREYCDNHTPTPARRGRRGWGWRL